MSSAVSINVVCPPAGCGEGPHWEEAYCSLLFVDIPGGKIHRYFPHTGRHQELALKDGKTGDAVSFVLPVQGRPDVLVIGHGRSVAIVRWSPSDPDQLTATSTVLATVDQHQPTNRFNDAKCDPSGRIWAGTMAAESAPGVYEPELGSLFLLSESLQPTTCATKISISNGLAWSHDKKTFYYIDTIPQLVEAFDYDDVTGAIGNRRAIFDYKKAGLPTDLPDGMTIDVDGNIWVASYNGSKILCIEPSSGKVLRSVSMPVAKITSVCWGGADYTTLYATSATEGLSQQQLQEKPNSGAVFEIKGLGAKGLPPVSVALDPAVLRKIDA